MCGLAGWVDYTRKLDDEFPAIFAMTDTLALRGPDAEGIWKHRNALLGHRRLAVIDLSGGVQPMSYRFPTGQEVTLVYTGEVYNHDALRERLRRAGHEFRTRSDTEVVLHARSTASFCGLPQKSKRVCKSLPHKDFSSL